MKKKTFIIPVTWAMTGEYKIQASSLEEAKNIIMSMDTTLPEDASYLEDSLCVDEEGVIEKNDSQEIER
jgi:hypothetical protein